MIGSFIIWISFAAALISICLYFISVKKQNILLMARNSFYITVLGIVTVSALLLFYILQHRFEYNYIASYSSRDLPTALLITTFWAGQEGSFLLWALFTAIIGFVLQRYTRHKGMESEVMAVYSFVLAFLLFLIAIKSPFQYVWEVAANNVPKGFIPQDGKGLNPLLQNFWMIIHPPVLFTGFASLAVPFVFVVAALWHKQYGRWIQAALPWVLFSALSLGAGLMLGGYWAYGVLGWGGWWGWDPVENSSLIPWMVAIILVHTMLIQMLTGKLARTNFVLAVLAYLLVIYSTFLTRSGILANASVHSFVDSGTLAYTLLVIWLAATALSGFGMIILRRKELTIQAPPSAWLTRESLLSIATIVMGVCAAVILFGTSKPLFSSSTVEPSYYNSTNLPLAILMTLLLGLSLSSKWNKEEHALFLRRLVVPGIISVVVLSIFIIMGLHDFFAGLLVLTSLFAFFVSIYQGYRIAKEQPRFIGGTLSHAGLAILFLGIIASGRYGQKQSISLPLNQPKSMFGYELTYTGMSPTQDGKTKFIVSREHNGKRDLLEPVMFESQYNNSLMRNPDYLSSWFGDFYLEPVSIEQGETDQQNMIVLVKDEPQMYGPITITFQRFDMGAHGKSGMMGGGNSVTIGAVLQIKTDKDVQEIVPTTTYDLHGNPEMKTAYLKNGHLGFQLVAMNVGSGTKKSQVQINVVGVEGMTHAGTQKPETLIAEISVKPFINFVWIASVMIICGLTIAMLRRSKQSNI
ncbi:MAG: cytochrome c biogenesis protein CcsA [Bacteroidota bacterium]|jgi:cytochrome c-type biogenesis protein CcmF